MNMDGRNERLGYDSYYNNVCDRQVDISWVQVIRVGDHQHFIITNIDFAYDLPSRPRYRENMYISLAFIWSNRLGRRFQTNKLSK